MDQRPTSQTFRRFLFWLTSVFLFVHVLLSVQYVVFKHNLLPGKLNSFYTKLIIAGPFFREDRIAISPHLLVSYPSASGAWLPFEDVAKKNFEDYRHHPWRYDKLKWSDYERHVTQKAYKEIGLLKQIDGTEGYSTSELTRYICRDEHQQADSIKLLYIWSTWEPLNKSVRDDTIFNVVFKKKGNGYAR